jgi:protein O-mannosyl-transferase
MGILYAVIPLSVLVIYGQVLWYGFLWDDIPTIVTNSGLKTWATFWNSFTHDFWGLHEVPERSGYWRPIPTVLYLFASKIFGSSAAGFHLLNVVLHAGISLLAVRFFIRVGLDRTALLFASIFFALNPIHTEAVSFVSALPDLSAAFFGLLFLESGYSPKGVLFLALSLLSKESAVAFLPLHFVLREGDESRKRELFWIAFILAIYVLLHWKVTGGLGQRSLWGGTLDRHLGTVLLLLPAALFLSLVPIGLSPTREFPISEGFSDPRVWGALCLVVALSWAAWKWRSDRPFSVGFVTFILLWLPISNLLPAEGLISDRYLYLPALGVALMCSKLGAYLKKPLLIGFAVVWGAWAFYETAKWESSESLWATAVRRSPGANLAWNEWGKVMLDRNDLSGAESAFQSALRISPEYKEALLNLAVVDYRLGRAHEAWERLERNETRFERDAAYHDLKGAVAELNHLMVEAEEESRQAVALAPKNWKYAFNLATILLKNGKSKESRAMLESLSRSEPDVPQIWMNLAASMLSTGDPEAAKECYRTILRKWPDHERARAGLASLERS